MKVASLQHPPSIKTERITQLPPTVKEKEQILNMVIATCVTEIIFSLYIYVSFLQSI